MKTKKKCIIIILWLLALTGVLLAVKTFKIIQTFNAGELSPLMDARMDQAKYVAGCRTLENFIPLIYGGAQRRPGTEFIATCKASDVASRLMGFEHSVDDTYMLEFANQVIRVFKDGARVFAVFGTEDLSSLSGNITAHWKMNDNASTSVVIDADGATHDGALYDGADATGGANQETADVTDTDGVDGTNRSFDMSQLDTSPGMVSVTDSSDFSFDDSSSETFTLHAWVKFTSTGVRQDIITKWATANQEWELYIDDDDKIVCTLYDDSAEVSCNITSSNALTEGLWQFIVVTYNGAGGTDAANGMNLYVNWVLADAAVTNSASYVAMEDKGAAVLIGGRNGTAQQVQVPQAYRQGVDNAAPLIGDMTANGKLMASFDGDNDENSADCSSLASTAVGHVGKDWGVGNDKVISGFQVWGGADNGFANTNPDITVTLQGSPNNSTWTGLGSVGPTTDTGGSNPGPKMEKLSGLSTTAYRYHRLKIASSAGGVNLFCAEIIFYEKGGASFENQLDNVAVFDKELTSSEVAALVSTDTTSPLEITTPYLTADLFELKFEQSADIMFMTHPSYEIRKLSRLSDTSWVLSVLALETGPFRDQNTDTTKTITASATTGTSITLTAVGHAPFVDGTTAGHEPSGSSATSKVQTGALFKLIQAAGTSNVGEDLNSTTQDAVTTTLEVPKGVTWDFTTNGTWGSSGTSTIVLERSYDSGTTYETVVNVTSKGNKNVATSGTEDIADAIYRARVSDGTGTGTAEIQFSIRDTSHIGIVKITAVASTTSATAEVLTTLASTDPTHRWSEGSFSNYRGWPIDVKISSEERLTFAGNIAEPLSTWGSAVDDWTSFREGTLDDDAISFTLIGSGQQNRIRWLVSKDSLFLGTVGGEHLLGASKVDEALTPTNARARLQTTYGSEDIAALIVNQAILFVQRGGKKIREFLYNFDADAHKADDLTVFSEHITGDGIVNMAYQRTPDPTLWCIRTDGEIAIMTYERDQKVFSWSRIVTRSGDEFESIAIIFGGTRSEDEVWVTVKRSVNSATVRYVERFFERAMPSSVSDMKFLDSYITDTGGDTTITGLSHLEGETVQVLGDGLVQATKTVSSSQITAATTTAKYQVGLGYTSTLKPMKLDIGGVGLATTKRINKAIVNVFETIGGEVGPSTSDLESIPTGTGALFTGHKEISMPGGYSREGDIIIRQTDPLPLTALSLTLEVGIGRD